MGVLITLALVALVGRTRAQEIGGNGRPPAPRWRRYSTPFSGYRNALFVGLMNTKMVHVSDPPKISPSL